jgi:hypothetical protein
MLQAYSACKFHCIIIFKHWPTISTILLPCTKQTHNVNAMKNASGTHTILMQNYKAYTCNDNCLPTFKACACNDHDATTFYASTCKPTIHHYYERHWWKCTGLIMPLEHALQCMKVLPKHCFFCYCNVCR